MTGSDEEARGHELSPEGTEPNGDHPRRIDQHIAYFGDRITIAARTDAAARRSPPSAHARPAPE